MKSLCRIIVILLVPYLCSPLSDAGGPPGITPSPTTIAAPTATPTVTKTATPTDIPRRVFADGFDVDRILEETDRMANSADSDWWVNSGGWFVQAGGVGSTWIGESPAASRWRLAYLLSNPVDTDRGAHPQNLFRLIARSVWIEPDQQVYFRIRADNLSSSPNRTQSNGVLLFSRYADGENLYYAGLRVDGYAVIKKKIGGAYATLAETPWFPGTYDRTAQPNLIPHDAWIGLRTVVHAEGNIVVLQLYIDPDRSGF